MEYTGVHGKEVLSYTNTELTSRIEYSHQDRVLHDGHPITSEEYFTIRKLDTHHPTLVSGHIGPHFSDETWQNTFVYFRYP